MWPLTGDHSQYRCKVTPIPLFACVVSEIWHATLEIYGLTLYLCTSVNIKRPLWKTVAGPRDARLWKRARTGEEMTVKNRSRTQNTEESDFTQTLGVICFWFFSGGGVAAYVCDFLAYWVCRKSVFTSGIEARCCIFHWWHTHTRTRVRT